MWSNLDQSKEGRSSVSNCARINTYPACPFWAKRKSLFLQNPSLISYQAKRAPQTFNECRLYMVALCNSLPGVRMRFLQGQEVEIASKEEGFIGSYYAATIVTYIQNEFYLVQYKELLREDGSGPLREVIRGEDIRPTPPTKSLPTAAGFTMLDRVDTLYNDGWWTGTITGKEGSRYIVHFENSGEELAFSDSDLRRHLEWVNGNWIATTRRRILLPQKRKQDS